jgi:hypothetical protein
MYGVEIHYIPRKYITEKSVLREVIESEFRNAYPIEAYVENFDGYGDNTSILTKFGIEATNEITLTISKERYETYISPLIANIPNIELFDRPKEGDLIYFPLGDRLFEIKYVEHEKPFYQLQKNYVYVLKCELFRYEDEILDTSIGEIDDNVITDNNLTTLTLVSAGVTATATATIADGVVSQIFVTNRGSGYTSLPRVAISSSPSPGLTATATGIATFIEGIIDCNGLVSNKVQAVYIVNPGYGYTTNPSVSFIGGGGSGAAATTRISDDAVGSITITNGGSGYVSPPTITFSSPGAGTTATGIAVVGTGGTISAIRITNTGSGYSSAPTITIGSPYTSGIGTFILNETVTGSTSGTSAIVKSWNAVTGKLDVSNITGAFTSGETLVGSASSASYQLSLQGEFNTTDNYPANDEIEFEADSILDFTERNPFGNP